MCCVGSGTLMCKTHHLHHTFFTFIFLLTHSKTCSIKYINETLHNYNIDTIMKCIMNIIPRSPCALYIFLWNQNDEKHLLIICLSVVFLFSQFPTVAPQNNSNISDHSSFLQWMTFLAAVCVTNGHYCTETMILANLILQPNRLDHQHKLVDHLADDKPTVAVNENRLNGHVSYQSGSRGEGGVVGRESMPMTSWTQWDSVRLTWCHPAYVQPPCLPKLPLETGLWSMWKCMRAKLHTE